VNDLLNERIRRKLDVMPDEQAYQVLDYIEFLESKYSQRAAGLPRSRRSPKRWKTRCARDASRSPSFEHDGRGRQGRPVLRGPGRGGKAAVEEAKKQAATPFPKNRLRKPSHPSNFRDGNLPTDVALTFDDVLLVPVIRRYTLATSLSPAASRAPFP